MTRFATIALKFRNENVDFFEMMSLEASKPVPEEVRVVAVLPAGAARTTEHIFRFSCLDFHVFEKHFHVF